MPDAPDVIVIQGVLAATLAVQVQPATVVTFAVRTAPAAATFAPDGSTVKLHPDAWFTVSVCPCAVIVP